MIDQKITELETELRKEIKKITHGTVTQITGIESLLKESEKANTELKDKLRTLEDRNRRNNLRINGIYGSKQKKKFKNFLMTALTFLSLSLKEHTGKEIDLRRDKGRTETDQEQLF